jgi:hypothetical protein
MFLNICPRWLVVHESFIPAYGWGCKLIKKGSCATFQSLFFLASASHAPFALIHLTRGCSLSPSWYTQSGFPVFGGNGIIGFYPHFLYDLPQILVSCRGAASGKIMESLPQSYVTSNSLVLELKDRFYYNYLKSFLLRNPLYDYATGSAQPQITIDNIKGVKILLPPRDIIQKINFV